MNGAATPTGRGRPAALAAIVAAGVALAIGFAALGLWQLDRRAWKLDLIARVGARVGAAPVAAPGPAAWPRLDAGRAEYLRVRASGRFLHGRETLVRASTVLGAGRWLMTPLRTDRGFTLLVNRGFVPDGEERRWRREPGPVTVTGLLRASEPGGALFRPNDAAADAWGSRDVLAIGQARGLRAVAPYFIDAEAGPGRSGYPVGGLTRVRFRNHHLAYALTWFTLALLVAGALAIVARRGRAG